MKLIRLPKIQGFPLSLIVTLTTVWRTNMLHCDKSSSQLLMQQLTSNFNPVVSFDWAGKSCQSSKNKNILPKVLAEQMNPVISIHWACRGCHQFSLDQWLQLIMAVYVKKLTSLKFIVRTMWWYHSTKTAKIFLGNPRWGYAWGVHKLPMHSYI